MEYCLNFEESHCIYRKFYIYKKLCIYNIYIEYYNKN